MDEGDISRKKTVIPHMTTQQYTKEQGSWMIFSFITKIVHEINKSIKFVLTLQHANIHSTLTPTQVNTYIHLYRYFYIQTYIYQLYTYIHTGIDKTYRYSSWWSYLTYLTFIYFKYKTPTLLNRNIHTNNAYMRVHNDIINK